MLSATPLAAALIDPEVVSGAEMTEASISPAEMVAETANAAADIADAPQQSDQSADNNLLQQFGLSEPVAELQQRFELVFVDDAVDNFQQLLDDLASQDSDERHFEVVLLNADRDGIEQVSETLAAYHDIDAVHFISHGDDGRVKLGSTWLDGNSLGGYAGEIAAWGNSFAADADLLFYGCDLAGNAAGQQLIDSLATLTGADVAASTDDTGAASLGGDWDLEFIRGEIETTTAFSADVQDAWTELMAASSSGTAIWRESGSSTPEYNEWDGLTFGTEGNAASIGEWRIIQGAESPTRDEKIVLGIDSGGQVEGQIWDGSSWSTIPLTMGSVSETFWWGVDVQYSSQTGDALLVWTDGSNLEYATWDGSSWSSVSTIGAYTGATPRQIQLASNPIADEMVLVVSDSGSNDFAFVWDGSSWGNAISLATSGLDDRTDINVAYEQQSGVAMVVYGNNSTSALYRTWNGASWSLEQSVARPSGAAGVVKWTTLAADPNSDRLALGVLTSANSIWFNVWDGSAWTSEVIGTLSSPTTVAPTVAVAFESESGNLLATYAESATQVRYRTWSSGSGWSSQAVGPNLFNTPNSMTLSADPKSDAVMLSVQDDANDLHFIEWDGSSWGADNQVETNTGEIENQPFLFLYDADHPLTNVVPGPQATDEDVPLTFSIGNGNSIQISADSGENLEVTLSVTNGTLTLSGTTGLAFTSGDGTADASMTFTGTVESINAALAGLTFTPTSDFNGSATLTLSSADAAYAALNISVDQQGYYTFDDTGALGTDDSGNGNTGTVVGAVAVNDAERGDVLSLDGAARDYVQIGGRYGDAANVTLAGWVNLTSIDTGGAELISLGDSIGIRLDGSGMGVYGFYFDGTTWQDLTTSQNVEGTGWHHIAYTFDDTNNVHKVYIDGVEVASAAAASSISYTLGSDSFIGRHGDGHTDEDLTGLVDDIRIYNRALTLAEIQSLALDPAVDSDDVAITVNAVNDAPVITSNGGGATAAINVQENTTAVTMVTSADVDGGSPSYSIAGGADAGLFSINSSTGELTFASAPDFETPIDADGNNVYEVTVQASDGTLTDTQDISVTVTAVNDNSPIITSNGGGASAAVNVAENTTAVTTVAATDADLPAQTLTYSIVGGADAGLFAINGSTGDLTFSSARDFETPIDADGNNVYEVTVQASDGTLTDTQDISVTVTAVNDNDPIITSNGGGSSAAVNVAENTTAVTTVAATDADLPTQTLTYSIVGGADAGLFTINGSTGELTFASAPDFETPIDADGNNVYEVTVQASDGTLTDTQDISVTVTAVNDNDPIITSNGGGSSAAVNVAENTTAVTTVAATDADLPTQTLTYSIVGGADAGLFTINGSTGELTFASAPDFETPIDADGNNVYEVTVQASDGTLNDTQDISVTVTAVNDNDPIITSNGGGASAAVNVAENSTAVTTVAATDADLPAQTLTYSIVGGADAGRFTINGSTGELTFASAPDFETPIDADGNNVYEVTVQASDGTLTDTQDISVTVTAVNDNNPVITSNGGGAVAAVNVAENTTAVTTVAATDADLPAQTLTYSIVGGADAGLFTINGSTGELTFASAPDFETPIDADGNNVYEVTVQASDGTLTDTQDISVTVTAVNDNDPIITSNGGGASAAVNVAENTTAVTTVAATDADLPAQTLTYSIVGGADAGLFTINGSTGELTFASAPDFETPIDADGNNVYEVTVQASDGTLTDTQDISVTVTDVNEAPTAADNTVTTDEDTAYTFTAADFNFSDIDGDPLAGVRITALETAGSLQLSGVDVTLNQVINRADIDAGNLKFIPVANANGAGYDSFGFSVSDGLLESASSSVMTVDVTSINDAPTAADNTVTTDEDTAYTLTAADFNFSDIDVDPLASVRITALETAGSLQLGGVDVTLNQVISRADIDAGNLKFVPALDANGAGYDSFGFSVSDGLLESAGSYLMTIDVVAVNDAPVISSDGGGATATANVAENTTAVTTVTSTDVDGSSPVYSISGGTDADKFFINSTTGNLSFISAPDYENPTDADGDNVYEVTVRVSDGSLSDTQAILVSIIGVDESAPTKQRQPEEPIETEDPTDETEDDPQGPTGNPGIAAEPPVDPVSREHGYDRSRTPDTEPPVPGIQPVMTADEVQASVNFTVFRNTGNTWQYAKLSQLASADSTDGLPSVSDVEIVNTQLLWKNLNAIQDQINLNTIQHHLVISAAAVVTTTVSSGFVIWALRGSYLVASLLSGLPAWRFIDPIAILDEFDEGDEGDGESLEHIIERAEARVDERNIDQTESAKT